jgi:hypothetical protein
MLAVTWMNFAVVMKHSMTTIAADMKDSCGLTCS